MNKIVTIGVYGFDKDSFFKALLDAHVDTFCDIRLRRGMRGSEYAFVNSERLQRQLRELGIRYVHIKDLAPSRIIREKQKQEDEKLGIAKRSRKALGQTFIREYDKECLSCFNSYEFMKMVGLETEVVGLFCVEQEPEACHRSLAANRLSRDLALPVEHMRPHVSAIG
nr:DUF488 domain-containing protein [Ktedonobacteraceae bacterium]